MTTRFKPGDKGVYPGHGLVEVMGIEYREIAGSKTEFYILKILDSDMKLMIPVTGAKRAGLRPVICKEEAEKVIEILKDPTIAVTAQPWNRRYREYTEMLNSGSAFEIAKVLRDLYRVKEGKELSYSERRLRDQARSLLITELALAHGCDTARVEEQLQAVFGSA
jgi:CarD family transcriptional regulator